MREGVNTASPPSRSSEDEGKSGCYGSKEEGPLELRGSSGDQGRCPEELTSELSYEKCRVGQKQPVGLRCRNAHVVTGRVWLLNAAGCTTVKMFKKRTNLELFTLKG